MASRSGRRGEFPPESKDIIQQAMFKEDDADNSYDDDDDDNDNNDATMAVENVHPNSSRSATAAAKTSSSYSPSLTKRQPRRSSKSSPAPPPALSSPPTSTAATATATGGSRGMISPSSPETFAAATATTTTPTTTANGATHPEEGCRACGRDDDHANLLLCEACNDEYHTYCLTPPLQSVPEGDFFCVQCKHLHSTKDDDGLDSLVSALPPSYTSRFGEIVWAAGGVGFGWWPACIYDPRLTVGGARQLARKNLGKKHLVYFFECNDAPFTVLGEHKLTNWEDGILEEYDAGKVARSSKSRSVSFEKALQVARLENGRPMEMRMDWNHQGNLVVVQQPKIPKGASGGGGARQSVTSPVNHAGGGNGDYYNQHLHLSKKIKPSPTSLSSKSLTRVTSSSSINNNNTSNNNNTNNNKTAAPAHSVSQNSTGNEKLTITVNRKNMNSAIMSLSYDGANAIEPLEDGRLVCKILRKIPLSSNCGGDHGTLVSEGMEFSNNVGFVTLRSRQTATFECVRQAIENDFDNDCFQQVNNKKSNGWKFYVPKLGPVSVKQERKIGPVLEFLRSTTSDVQLGNGTASNPLKIVIMDR